MAKKKPTIEVKPEWYDAELEAAIPDRPAWHPWSKEQDAKLAYYYPRGVPIRLLSERVNHNEAATKHRLHILGITRKPRSAESPDV